ncbi:MAG: hypothetical protein OHK0029_01740 [Armatimonadaceae bacterium]
MTKVDANQSANGSGLQEITHWLLPAGILYTLIYIVFWPATYAIMDESSYMGLAYAFRQGTVYTDVAQITAAFTYPLSNGHTISQYPPGMSLVLAATSFLGWSFTLGTNLFVHLGIFATVAAILRQIHVPARYAIFYLFHPTAVIYSRTVMSDLLASLLLTGAFYFLLRRQAFGTGAFIGLSTLVRNANIVAVVLFAFGAFLDESEGKLSELRRKSTLISGLSTGLKIGLAALPFYFLAFLYQQIFQEGGWARFSNQLSFVHLFPNLLSYGLKLAILYPGMILAPLLYRGRGRYTLRLVIYSFISLYSFYHFQDSTGSLLESFVIGQRYMLLIIPLLIVSYGAVLHQAISQFRPGFQRPVALFSVMVFLVLALGSGLVHFRHQKYLNEQRAVRDALIAFVTKADTVVCNIHVGKLFHPGWGNVTRYKLMGGEATHEAAVKNARQVLNEALTQNAGRIVLINWSRDYRPETSKEQSLFADLVQEYQMTVIKPNTLNLPNEVQIAVSDSR